jgi:predicted RNase H-like HicB family nuclease
MHGRHNITMNTDYPVVLKKSEEGYAVGCPSLPGCWSQGKTEKEALDNIRVAIQEYLLARESLFEKEDVRMVSVAV